MGDDDDDDWQQIQCEDCGTARDYQEWYRGHDRCLKCPECGAELED